MILGTSIATSLTPHVTLSMIGIVSGSAFDAAPREGAVGRTG